MSKKVNVEREKRVREGKIDGEGRYCQNRSRKKVKKRRGNFDSQEFDGFMRHLNDLSFSLQRFSFFFGLIENGVEIIYYFIIVIYMG